MNVVSIISVGVAILSLLLTTIWNITNAKRNANNDYQNILQLIKKESLEQGETKMLFQQMSTSLQQIVEDNKRINERLYNLTERITLVEHDQHGLTNIINQIALLDSKISKAQQHIDIIEHDLKLTEKEK